MSAAALPIALALAAAAAPAPTPPPPVEAPPPRARHAPGDPLEGFNRAMFRVFLTVDKALFRPAALAYAHVVPRPVRGGARHFLANLGEPVVFLNDLLQLRPGRAVRTFARFLINSTIGVGGLIDVATPEKLSHRPNGFGDTLGYYGVRPGPYIFLPVLGPGTLRDLIGGAGDGAVLPAAIGAPFDRRAYVIPRTIVAGLDQRAEADGELTALRDTALDPYALLRSAYLQTREAEIRALKAKGPNEPGEAATFDDPLDDPAATPGDAPTPLEEAPEAAPLPPAPR